MTVNDRFSNFKFIDEINKSISHSELSDIFDKIIARFGLTSFIAVDISSGMSLKESEVYLMGAHWSRSWASRYAFNDYALHDPILKYAFTSRTSYLWSDVIANIPPSDARAWQIINEARTEFGMHCGFCIPVHGPDGSVVLISMAADNPAWTLSLRDRMMLHVIGLHVFEAAHKLRPQRPVTKILSDREAACVKWISEGKTTWETSVILNISESTTRGYLSNAAKKLQTTSLAHLAAKALRLKIIR